MRNVRSSRLQPSSRTACPSDKPGFAGLGILTATIAGLLFTVSGPVCADPPPREVAIGLGYCTTITEMLDTTQRPRAPKDPLYEPPNASRRQGPDDTQLRDMLVPQVYMRAEPGKMIPTLIRLHQQQPLSEKITRKLALTCLKAGQPREALHWFTRTYQLDRTDIQALWNMAALSYRLGDFPATAAFLKEYARIDPYTAWGRLAREFQDSGNYAGIDFSKPFAGEPSRGGMITSGTGQTPGSVLLIDGKPANPEDAIPSLSQEAQVPIAGSSGKGKKGKSPTEAEKAQGTGKSPVNSSINSAKILEEAPPPPAPAAAAAAAPAAAGKTAGGAPNPTGANKTTAEPLP
jgi:hypothetical protein